MYHPLTGSLCYLTIEYASGGSGLGNTPLISSSLCFHLDPFGYTDKEENMLMCVVQCQQSAKDNHAGFLENQFLDYWHGLSGEDILILWNCRIINDYILLFRLVITSKIKQISCRNIYQF